MSKSAVVRGASKAASIWNKIDTAVKAKGGTDEALDILDTKDGAPLVDVIADLLVKAELKTRNRFAVTVDYSQPLADMVGAGKYDFVDDNIVAKNFPLVGTGLVEQEVVVVHFDRSISSDTAVAELEQMGLKPAPIEYLLALGAKHLDLQREYPIVAFGSVWTDSDGYPYVLYVPCLGPWIVGRELHLRDWVGGWSPHYRFLALRK